jgi:hypothetical protein
LLPQLFPALPPERFPKPFVHVEPLSWIVVLQ